MSNTRKIISTLSALLIVSACGDEEFDSGSKKIVDKPENVASANPGGIDTGKDPGDETIPDSAAKRPSDETIPKDASVCSETYEALRIGIVVDNTGSNNSHPGKVQYLSAQEDGGCTDAANRVAVSGNSYLGTDSVRCSPSEYQGLGSTFTDRQAAIYEIVTRISGLDKEAKAKTAEFLGSDIGISYFPKDAKSKEGVRSAEFLNPSSPMQPADKIITGDADKATLWNSMQFTHTPDGLTSYEAAMKGCQTLLGTTAEGDKRKRTCLVITDGLSNDEDPAAVRAARDALGDMEVIVFSLYIPGSDEATEQSFVKKLWDNNAWGKDKFNDFNTYWGELKKLPNYIAYGSDSKPGDKENIIYVEQSSQLKGAIEAVIQAEQKCTQN